MWGALHVRCAEDRKRYATKGQAVDSAVIRRTGRDERRRWGRAGRPEPETSVRDSGLDAELRKLLVERGAAEPEHARRFGHLALRRLQGGMDEPALEIREGLVVVAHRGKGRSARQRA